nr:50s ribosomal protein l19, chloroplastic [Quercus suber]
MMKMAAVKLKFDQKSGWLSKILNFCSKDAKVVFTAVTVSILFKSFWADSRSIPSSSMALTLDVGGGSSLVAVNHGLRTCSGGRLSSAWWILNKRAIEAAEKERPVPDIRTGDILEIKLEVPENKRRLSVYKGIVISRQNAGIHTTIRIRRIIAGVGVEIVFPLYSPNIKEIKVVKHRKVRRARLYYLRDKLPRLSTFK